MSSELEVETNMQSAHKETPNAGMLPQIALKKNFMQEKIEDMPGMNEEGDFR